MPFDHVVRSEAELYAVYEQPSDGVRAKAVATFDEHCRAFIGLSPFVLVATAGADGRCDVSPRGGAPGFAAIIDDARLVIADASGNNRLDTVRNIVQTGRVGLLFLIPGLAETLRVNGRASISRDPALLEAHVDRRQAAEVRDRRRHRGGVPALREGLHALDAVEAGRPGPTAPAWPAQRRSGRTTSACPTRSTRSRPGSPRTTRTTSRRVGRAS